MAPIDLKKNGESILKAHKDVSDPHSKTNWALFGYEGQSDVLKVLSTGDGGLEELQEDLSAGKILYAYVKILDPNTNLPKFVFINWQGEGVPEQRKGGCASHVRDVQALLRGAHVSINARTEDDVEESVVIQKVSKASGANYSFHKEEKRPMPAIGPVGSVYEKVRPQIEIKPDIREKFWEESEREEKQRILLEKQRQAQEKAKLDKEAKEREVAETRAREEREAERLRKIRDIKSAEKQASETSVDKSHWDESDAKRDEDERAKRSDQMRKDRAAEAKSLVAGKTSGIRSAFEQKPTSQFDKAAPPARKLQQPSFLDSQSGNEPAQRKQPIQLPKGPSSPPAPTSPPAHTTRAAAPPPAAAEEEMYEDVAAVQQQHEDTDELYDDASTIHKAAAAADSAPATRNLLAQGLPQRPPSDDEQEDYQNWEDDDDRKPAAPQPARVVAPEPDEELYQDTGNVTPAGGQKQTNDDEQLYEDTGNSGVTARALYDYQAAEENEITFDPDDIISNIEMIDEGWWIGTTANGHRGMFPSNYVELF